MGTGLKFNARKSSTDEDYLGIRIFRFTMRCKACPASFSIRTDPKNSDYQCESGVKRNFEPWREEKDIKQKADGERAEQDKDAMQALENRTKDAKEQMEELDALDHIKSLNAKRAKVKLDDVLALYKRNQDGLTVADENAVEAQVQAAMSERNGKVSSLRPTLKKSPTMKSHFPSSRQSSFLHSALTVRVKKKNAKSVLPPCNDSTTQTSILPVVVKEGVSLVDYESSDSSGPSWKGGMVWN